MGLHQSRETWAQFVKSAESLITSKLLPVGLVDPSIPKSLQRKGVLVGQPVWYYPKRTHQMDRGKVTRTTVLLIRTISSTIPNSPKWTARIPMLSSPRSVLSEATVATYLKLIMNQDLTYIISSSPPVQYISVRPLLSPVHVVATFRLTVF